MLTLSAVVLSGMPTERLSSRIVHSIQCRGDCGLVRYDTTAKHMAKSQSRTPQANETRFLPDFEI